MSYVHNDNIFKSLVGYQIGLVEYIKTPDALNENQSAVLFHVNMNFSDSVNIRCLHKRR